MLLRRTISRTARTSLATLILLGTSCAPAGDDPSATRAVFAIDDVGRRVELPAPATRVVSLLPAFTETMFALGAGDLVVGRTRYDTDPALAHLTDVGGGLDPNLETIVSLQPDLVIAWESQSGSKIRERLESLGIPVFAAATRDTSAIFSAIASLGRLTAHDPEADSLAAHVRAQLDSVRTSVAGRDRPSVLYVVSLDPPMIAGLENFIAELIGVAGGEPVAMPGDRAGLSPQVSLEDLVRRQPDVVILPVGEDPAISLDRLSREPGWRDLNAVREGRVAELPADQVNRPGPGIGEMAKLLRSAIASATERR